MKKNIYKRKMGTENFIQLANVWKAEMSDKLMNADISHDVTVHVNRGKSIWNPSLAMKQKRKMDRAQSRTHHIKSFQLPKESIYVEANKLIRRENAEAHLHAKEERMVKRAIHNLEHTFLNCRKAAKLPLHDYENYKRKNRSNIVKTYASERNKQIDYQILLKNIHRIYKDITPRCSKIDNQIENMVWSTRIDQFGRSDISVQNLKNKNLNRKCRVIPQGQEIMTVTIGNDGKESISSKSIITETEIFLGFSEDSEKSKPYPTPKEISSYHNRDEETNETGFKISDESKMNVNMNFAYRFHLLRYWKAWRKFIFRTRTDKEKHVRINKIDNFLKRLAETVKDSSKESNSVTCEVTVVKNRNKPTSSSKRALCETEKHLGQIEDELNKSAIEAYKNLQKSLKNFHPKLQPKAKALAAFRQVDKKLYKTEIRTYPTPSFLARMESRYRERKKRWEEIERKKKEIQAEKEQIEKERQEEQLKMEELRKKEKLEALIKRRIERKRAEEEREMRKQHLRNQIKLAQEHYLKYLLLKIGFEPWKKLMEMRLEQNQQVVRYFQIRSSKTHLKHWRNYTFLQISHKTELADEMYKHILKRNSFMLLINEYNEAIKKLQVALDWSDTKSTEKAFKFWLQYTRKERWNTIKKEEIASASFNRLIKIKFFKNWKKFPVYMRSEKQKELRKRLLQRKVQEFLPDYQPAYVSEI